MYLSDKDLLALALCSILSTATKQDSIAVFSDRKNIKLCFPYNLCSLPSLSPESLPLPRENYCFSKMSIVRWCSVSKLISEFVLWLTRFFYITFYYLFVNAISTKATSELKLLAVADYILHISPPLYIPAFHLGAYLTSLLRHAVCFVKGVQQNGLPSKASAGLAAKPRKWI